MGNIFLHWKSYRKTLEKTGSGAPKTSGKRSVLGFSTVEQRALPPLRWPPHWNPVRPGSRARR